VDLPEVELHPKSEQNEWMIESASQLKLIEKLTNPEFSKTCSHDHPDLLIS
jgi:hypothetical protein